MIGVLQAVMFAATLFVEQDLPGLEAGSRVFPYGREPANIRAEDVNRDGYNDLVLPGLVRLQIAGRYPDTGILRLPENGRFLASHIERDLFFGVDEKRIVCYRLAGNTWSLFWEAAHADSAGLGFRPIFEDIDGDGNVELLVPSNDSVVVYRLLRAALRAGQLDVYPPLRGKLDVPFDLWTRRDAPRLAASMSREFRLSLDGGSMSVHERLPAGAGITEHRVTLYRVDVDPVAGYSARVTGNFLGEGLPKEAMLCRMNKGPEPDFAGLRPVESRRAPWAQPITDVILRVDAASSTTVIRTKASPNHLTMADIDADGDRDLIAETNDLFSGGPREIMMRLASDKRIRHVVSVHVQDVEGQFDASARALLNVRLAFDEAAIEGGARWDAYRAGWLTSTHGDFDGDGRADIVIWDTPHRVSVFFNHEGIFERNADTTIPVSSGYERVCATDVDADGKTDVVLVPTAGGDTPPKVFFSR